MRTGKYYLTAPIVEAIKASKVVKVIKTVAARNGFELEPDWQERCGTGTETVLAYLSGCRDELREAVNSELRNIKAISRVPAIKPTILRILRDRGGIGIRDYASCARTINSHPLAEVAAMIYANLSAEAWREICMMARHLQSPESSWLSFTLRPAAGSSPDFSDEAQHDIRKRICELIFENEGRADEGWCSYYHDVEDGRHCFIIDMTDHLSPRKERVGPNRFRVVQKKDVFDILFRYKPELNELSIRAEGPRGYRRMMATIWTERVFGSNAELLDDRHRFHIGRILSLGRDLAVPAGSRISGAALVGITIGSSVSQDVEYSLSCARGDFRKLIDSVRENAGLTLAELEVRKIDVVFRYFDRRGESKEIVRYFRPDSTNATRVPDIIKSSVMPLMKFNGLTDA